MKNITILNTSVLTNYGTYSYEPISLAKAKELINDNEIISAIGHSATADILSDLLEIEVKTNRIEFLQEVDEIALIFKLKSRIPEGKVLSRIEIDETGYDFGILRRVK